jgi:hypothetical protein
MMFLLQYRKLVMRTMSLAWSGFVTLSAARHEQVGVYRLDDAETKVRRAQSEPEHAQKIARRDRNKKWKPMFQELKRKVRERNARLKQQQKMAGKRVVYFFFFYPRSL